MQATEKTKGGAMRATVGAEPRWWLTRPGTLLRVEGGVLLAMSALLYWVNGGS